MLQQTDVIGHLMSAGCNSGKDIGNSRIHLAGIGLSGNRITFLKAHLLCNHRLLIAVKQLQERSLCSCGSLGAKELHAGKHMVKILKIQTEFLHPQGCTLSNGSRLCRLEMRKCQRRLCLVFICKVSKLL